jgi:predicted RNA-binding protein with PUA-like domain
MAKSYWLVKSEPESYSWQAFVKEGSTSWSGVRNYQARINLRAMKMGDRVFFYHSGSAKEILGMARVTRAAYPEEGAPDWSAVDLAPELELDAPVSLQTIKADKFLKELMLVKNSRLSVMPVTEQQFDRIITLARRKGG